DLLASLQQILPPNYTYQIKNYNELEPIITAENVNIGQINMDLYVDINTKEDALSWLNNFQEISKTTMRMETQKQYIDLFSIGHIAATTRHIYKDKLHLSASDDDELVYFLADRAKNLDRGFLRHLYHQFCLMRRVYEKILEASELCYLNASAAFDLLNTSISLLYTNCSVGALLLEIFLTLNEAKVTIENTINLLKTIPPNNAFSGHGSQ
ncbi:6768_t:CDS:2, partial [Scutellospora calospora]